MASKHNRQVSSEDWSSKDSQPEKENQTSDQNDNSTMEKPETIAPLPSSEIQQTTTTLGPQRTSSNLQNTRARLGLHPVAPVIEEHDVSEHSDLWWPKVCITLKEPFAEFWGVFFMVMFGDGSVAQVLLSEGQKSAPGGNGFGSYQSISWGWGLGVMLGIYIAGDSGAYLKCDQSLPSSHYYDADGSC